MIKIIIFLLFLTNISFAQIIFTTTLGDLGDVTPAKARAAIEGYLAEVSKEIGEEIIFKFPEEGETTISSFIKGKADVITTSAANYAELVDKKVPLVLLAKYKKAGKDYLQAGLYVRKDSNIESIRDLKGKKIAVLESLSMKNSNERIFLKMLLKKEGIKEDPSSYFGKEVIVKKASSRAMAVIFGEVDATILDVVTIEEMAKLKKRYAEIKPIAVSGKYPWGAMIASPKLGKEKIEKIKKILYQTHKTPKGKQFLFSIQFEEIIPAEDKDYEEIKKMWREFSD